MMSKARAFLLVVLLIAGGAMQLGGALPLALAKAAGSARSATAVGAGIVRSAQSFAHYYSMAQQRNKQGHGVMAEHLGHFWDTMAGRHTLHLGGDNAKDAADRRVGGTDIQVKYHKSAEKTFSALFKHGDPTILRYKTAAGSQSSFMRIEVPKDQYAKVLTTLQRRIGEGKVRGITNPKEASNILKPGVYTYAEAVAITRPGTFASVRYDIQTGAITGLLAGSTSLVWQVFDNMRNLKDEHGNTPTMDELVSRLQGAVKEAIKDSGRAVALHVATAQLLRAGYKAGVHARLAVPLTKAVVLGMGEQARQQLAFFLRGAPLYGAAASSYLTKLVSHTVVGNGVAMTTMVAPRVWKFVWGRSSAGELAQDISGDAVRMATGSTGYSAGAVAGAALGSVVPVIGTTVGGFVGGMLGATVAGMAASWVLPSCGKQPTPVVEPQPTPVVEPQTTSVVEPLPTPVVEPQPAQHDFDTIVVAVILSLLDQVPSSRREQAVSCLAKAGLTNAVRADLPFLNILPSTKLALSEVADSISAVADACGIEM